MAEQEPLEDVKYNFEADSVCHKAIKQLMATLCSKEKCVLDAPLNQYHALAQVIMSVASLAEHLSREQTTVLPIPMELRDRVMDFIDAQPRTSK